MSLNIWDFIPWAGVAISIGFIIWGIVYQIKEGSQGIDFLKFVGLFLSGVFVFNFASNGCGDVVQSILRDVNFFVKDETADGIGRLLVGAWGVTLFFYIKHRVTQNK